MNEADPTPARASASTQAHASPDDWRAPFQAPEVSLPKGGGAIRGMGEKFAANPVTGSASFSVPIPAPPGRGGFGPTLALRYDSGSGNGPFGFGWSLDLPTITRKTDKGLPLYGRDTDTFVLSDAEDLVPVLDPAGRVVDQSVDGFQIRRFRPRVEGLFARIERWTSPSGDVHWRSISTDNVRTIFGRDSTSRIHDPEDPSRVYSWLVCETMDDRGNAIVYDYRPEDGAGLDLDQLHERRRGPPGAPSRLANRYLDRVRYGNATTLLDQATLRRPRELSRHVVDGTRWMFQLAFDYREPAEDAGAPDQLGAWTPRPDPFSRYRACFEVRTYRLCHRILLLHDFPDDPDVGARRLVRSVDLTYRTAPQSQVSSDPGFTFLAAAVQRSYQERDGVWHTRQLPPVQFTYSEAAVDDQVCQTDPDSLDNLPVGLGGGYRWVDLDGEGVSGVLTEQEDAWIYKPNLGSGPRGPRLGAAQRVPLRPAMAALNGGRQQLLDLQGDGALALVDFDPPAGGFHKRAECDGWTGLVPFVSRPNIDWSDPNLRFVDLTGDGLADVLVTEGDVFSWYPSRAEQGFGPSSSAVTAALEANGPRVVFADAEQAIYLADMSGDGLTDLVRIRNGETCYWPNLGFGRWAAQVVMDDSPWFDHDDQFDRARIRLADIDGSGTTDFIYLGREGATLWLNRSGNGWGEPRSLRFPVATSNVGQIQVADLQGNGTACLVWSSELPGDADNPLRYLDLMGGVKPHLMVEMDNNLGAVTSIDYVASTHFYLQDKAAGTPWVTKLPFPVHCVARVTVTDLRRRSTFSTTYSYHHGLFDPVEREFRGFGRVDQLDTQAFDHVSEANAGSPFVAADLRLYQPPIKTTSWFHTGNADSVLRILGSFEREYFPARYADRIAAGGFDEHHPLDPEIETDGPPLDTEEWREAVRACKGMLLRQEVAELDAGALHDRREERVVRLFSAVQTTCRLRRVQARGPNDHAVFLASPSETLSYHYELDVRGTGPLEPDPRIEHTLNLRFDRYGRVLESVVAVYPRRLRHTDSGLSAAQLGLVRAVHDERHLAFEESRYCDELPADGDTHRLPPRCETRTFELTGIDPGAGSACFTLDRLRDYRIRTAPAGPGTIPVSTLDYHQQPPDEAAYRRLVEHGVSLFFTDDLAGAGVLGTTGRLALPYEAYKLALTEALIDAVFTGNAGEAPTPAEARSAVSRAAARPGFLASGYRADVPHTAGATAGSTWWLRSGVAGFAVDAAEHFYLAERYLDAFGVETTLAYDADDLFVRSRTDARGNTTTVDRFDHRSLAPARLIDANDNHSEVAFDLRGLPVAAATMGKVLDGESESGDTVEGLTFAQLNPDPATVIEFFAEDALDETLARRLLGKATVRFIYHLGESITGPELRWGATAAGVCHLAREAHERDATNDHPELGADGIRIQVGFAYSDGAGQAFVTKEQAEPDPTVTDGPNRWIANGKTILNNKGKPVLQFEPYFSPSGHRFEEPIEVGVSPVLFYDAPGRLVRTEFPDGTASRVEFSPWFSRSFDPNDTVLDPGNRWYAEHTGPAAGAHDKTAARLASKHARTPAETHVDSLGRHVIVIAHNATPSYDPGQVNVPLLDRPWVAERTLTFTKLDAEGKPLWICDALGNLVMQYVAPPRSHHTALHDGAQPDVGSAYDLPAGVAPCYDIAGNLLFQHSMDAGDRWMLHDAAGEPMLAWDVNTRGLNDGTTRMERRRFEIRYDALHRPLEQRLTVNAESPALIEVFAYTDTADFTSAAGAVDQVGLDRARSRNLLGQATRHYESSGLTTVDRVDLGGAVEEVTRTFVDDVEAAVVNWNVADRAALLEAETFRQINRHDALGRLGTQYEWHRDVTGQPGRSHRVAVRVPEYDARGSLGSETLHVQATKSPGPGGRPTFQPHADPDKTKLAITRLTRDAKGQRLLLELGNGTTTRYTYDPRTYQLVHQYTRRGDTFTDDCAGTPDAARPARPCGVQNLHYTYDAAGNLTHVQDDAQQTIWFANQQVEPSSDYCYDAAYRLIEAMGRENAAASDPPPHPEGDWPTRSFPSPDATRTYTQRYRYDRVGNVSRIQHIATTLPGQADGSWTREYAYAYEDPAQPASNRLWQTWIGGNRAQSVTFRHDRHGSLLNLANTAPGKDLRWDWRDMVRALDLGGGGDAFYSYGIDKQRTRKRLVRNGGSEDRIYLGGYELYRRRDAHDQVVEEIETLHVLEGQRRVLLVDDVLVAGSGPGRTV